MKTCEKLRELKFHSIRMMEVRQRPFDARVVELDTIDLGLSKEGELLNNRSTRDRTGVHQTHKPSSLGVPVFVPNSAAAVSNSDALATSGSFSDVVQNRNEEVKASASTGGHRRKKIKFMNGSDLPGDISDENDDDAEAGDETNESAKCSKSNGDVNEVIYEQGSMTDAQFHSLQNRIRNRPTSAVNGTYQMHVARPLSSMKGHTAFLTFAMCPLGK
jgi:hypothetical protein